MAILVPDHRPDLCLTSSSYITVLLLVPLITTWFHPHLIYFPLLAGLDPWCHCHTPHVLPQDLASHCCRSPGQLHWVPWLSSPTSALCSPVVIEPTVVKSLEPWQGWETLIPVTEEALFSCQHSASYIIAWIPHMPPSAQAVEQRSGCPELPCSKQEQKEGPPGCGSPLFINVLSGLWNA